MSKHSVLGTLLVSMLVPLLTILITPNPSTAVDGAAIFKSKCSACHGATGEGGPLAPAIIGTNFSKGDAGEIRDVIKNGREGGAKIYKNIPLAMPKFNTLSDAELDALTAHLQGRVVSSASPEPKPTPPKPSVAVEPKISKTPPAPAAPKPSVAVDGAAIFKSKCSACHGATGEGGPMAPAIIGTNFSKGDAGEVRNVIKNGREGGAKIYKNIPLAMPKFNTLSDAELDALTAHLQGRVVSSASPEPKPTPPKPSLVVEPEISKIPPSLATPKPSLAVDGAAIFKSKCSACHGAKGEGGPLAPAIIGTNFSKGDAGVIKDTIKNGREGSAKKYKNFPLSMPKFNTLSDAELDALTAHLQGRAVSSASPEPKPTPPKPSAVVEPKISKIPPALPTPNPSVAVDGAAIFKSKCSACHGATGEGGPMAPAIIGTNFSKGDAGEVRNAIKNGREGAAKKYKNFPLSMPKFNKILSDAELDALTAHLQGRAVSSASPEPKPKNPKPSAVVEPEISKTPPALTPPALTAPALTAPAPPTLATPSTDTKNCALCHIGL